MAELNKLQATCKNCEKEFILPIAVLEPEYLLENPGLLKGMQFFCTNCNHPNNFTVEEITLVD